jgi:hypothetical protein
MTREVSRENSQAAEEKDPNAVRPDVEKPPEAPEERQKQGR